MDLYREGVDCDDSEDAMKQDDEVDWDITDEELNENARAMNSSQVDSAMVLSAPGTGKTETISQGQLDFECGLLIEDVKEHRREPEDPDAEKISDLVEDMRDGKPGPETLKLFAGLDFGNKVFDGEQEYARAFLKKANAALKSSTEIMNTYHQLGVNARGELEVARHYRRAGSAPLVQTYKLPAKN